MKHGEAYLKQYQTFEEAETNIGQLKPVDYYGKIRRMKSQQFIEDVYNTKRLSKECSVDFSLGLVKGVHSKFFGVDYLPLIYQKEI